ncbi:MAG: hypothetical protein JSU77_09410 [Fidelibacterota bacterium]|nr:MAG: hypothetical protein JSU77_09410 [Candidatus Neomarinimicrobiota bacterium]
MNEIIIGVVILIILIAVFLSGRKQRLARADSDLTAQRTEKESWEKESVISYQQVQQLREGLHKLIEERLADRPEDKERLVKIIDDWADLKVQSFHERRSWIRRPDQTQQE